MAKLRILVDNEKQTIYKFTCPGCGETHAFCTKDVYGGPVWTFNGDMDKPTVRASILVTGSPWENRRCHSFITDGKIQFLDDCTHALRGQTVELPELD